MTAVKEKLADMIPEMPALIPDMSDDRAQQIINLLLDEKKEQKTKDVSCRIGAGKGEFKAPDDFDANNEEVYSMIERYALS